MDKLRSVIRDGQIVDGCDNCLNTTAKHGQNDVAKYNRQRDYDDHRQDLTQKFEGKNYVKTHTLDQSREAGYSDEDLRQLY